MSNPWTDPRIANKNVKSAFGQCCPEIDIKLRGSDLDLDTFVVCFSYCTGAQTPKWLWMTI